MSHDPRLIASEDKIEELKKTVPEWINRLERPPTPCVAPAFGPARFAPGTDARGQPRNGPKNSRRSFALHDSRRQPRPHAASTVARSE